jgi:hypothetical protein
MRASILSETFTGHVGAKLMCSKDWAEEWSNPKMPDGSDRLEALSNEICTPNCRRLGKCGRALKNSERSIEEEEDMRRERKDALR